MEPAPRSAPTPASDLPRRIGFRAAAALVVSGTLGVGIFLAPAGMARGLASPALVFAVWAFMGGTALCGALTFGELGARFPEAGGLYVYLREVYGPAVAFLYGWMCLLVLDPGLTAALATGFGAYARATVPALPPAATALAAIAAVAVANLAGVRAAAGIGHAFGVLKAALLALLVAWGFASGAGDLGHFLPFAARPAGAPPLVPALAGALVAAFFAFGGWWELARLGGEIREPRRTLPRALLLGVGAVTLLYAAVSAVFLDLVPLSAVTSSEAFAAQAAAVLFGPRGGQAMAAVVAVSVLGSLAAYMTMAPRVYYAMARDGVMPHSLARLGGSSGAPVRAVAVQAVLAALLVAVGSFDAIVAYFIFSTVVFLGLAAAGIFVLRRRRPTAPFRAPLYPWTPALFLVCLAVVLALLALGRPREAGLGSLVVALGVPAYLLLGRRRSGWRDRPQ